MNWLCRMKYSTKMKKNKRNTFIQIITSLPQMIKIIAKRTPNFTKTHKEFLMFPKNGAV